MKLSKLIKRINKYDLISYAIWAALFFLVTLYVFSPLNITSLIYWLIILALWGAGMVNKFMQKKQFRLLFDEGNENLFLGKFEDGIKSYTKAIIINNKEPIIYNNRSYANLSLGNIKNAYIDINKALKLSPRCVLAICTLGNIKQKEEKYKEAIINFEEAISIEPNNPNAYFYLYEVYSKLGDNVKAYNYLKKASDLGGDGAVKLIKKLETNQDYKDKDDKSSLEDFEKGLQELCDELVGGREEFVKLIRWQKDNLDLIEAEEFKESLKSNSPFRILYALGKLTVKYDELNGNERRKLADIEVENMIKFKRHIRAIGNGELIDFSYTMGNCVQNIPVPELLSFYPAKKTINFLLNILSEQLIDETIKPLAQGEVREVNGLLGPFGQIPVRLRLLDKNEKDESKVKWTSGLPYDCEIILVDIPDTNGFFASDPECQKHIQEKFPKSLRKNVPTTSIINSISERPVPCSLDAFYICLSQFTNYVRYVDPSNKDQRKELKWATIVILLIIGEEIEIDFDTSDLDNAIKNDLLEKIKNVYLVVSVVKTLKEWVALKLKFSYKEQLERTWCIGENNFVDFCRYQSIDSFLNEVEWELISKLVATSWESSCSKKETEKHRNAKLNWDKLYVDNESNDKNKLDVVSKKQDKEYILSEKEWEYADTLRNPDDLSKSDWQKVNSIGTKEAWLKIEKELDKEWEEIWSGPPRRTLKKTNLDIILPEIKSELQLVSLDIPRVQMLLEEGYTSVKDLSGMSFDDLLNIHHNLTWQGILNIYIALQANKLISKELLLELEDSLGPEVEYEWTDQVVPYKQLKYTIEPNSDRELSIKYFKEAWSKENLGNYEGAISDFTKAIELSPSKYAYFKRRGYAKHQYKDLKGAINDYNNSIELNPIDGETYKLRGFTKELLGDIQGAIDDYSESIEHISKSIARDQINDFGVKINIGDNDNNKNKDIAWSYYYRGKAKKELSDIEGACIDWTSASKLGNKEAAQLLEEYFEGNRDDNTYVAKDREKFASENYKDNETNTQEFDYDKNLNQESTASKGVAQDGSLKKEPLVGQNLLKALESIKKETNNCISIQERISYCNYEEGYEVQYQEFFEAVLEAKEINLSDINIISYSELKLILLAYNLGKYVKLSGFYQSIILELVKQKIDVIKALAIARKLDLKVKYGDIIETDYISNYISKDNFSEDDNPLKGDELINKMSEYDGGENYDLDMIGDCDYWAYDDCGNEHTAPFEFLCAVSEAKQIKSEDIDISDTNLEELALKVERSLNGKQKYYDVDFLVYTDIEELEFYALCKNFNFKVDVIKNDI